MKGVSIMYLKCETVDLKAQKTLCIRTRSSVKNLPAIIGKTYHEIMQYMRELGEAPSGVPYIGYFNMDMNDLDVEIGFPVAEDIQEKGNIKMSEVPAGKYATTIHKGSYSKLDASYTTLMDWVKENNLEGTYIGYEYYLNDPGEVSENELETKIIFQLKD
jgi:effector-binding domain-containing protein